MDTKLLMKLCPNYNFIMDYKCDKEEYFSKNLINYYSEYINKSDLNNILEQDRISKFDSALFEYINDPKFAKKVGEHFTFDENGFDMVEEVNNIYEEYEEMKQNENKATKWL